MNKAISTLLNSEISISREDRYRCSRKEMYAHFDFEAPFDIPSLVHKLNSFLPKIVIYDIIAVKEAAHARFDALKEPMSTTLTLLKIRFARAKLVLSSKLDVKLMNEAAMLLFNHIDFQCFSKVNTDVNTFDCTIFGNNNNRLILRFHNLLRNMVRSIVGTLVNVDLIRLHLMTLMPYTYIKQR
jgi:tRNA pseudouridine38-40 synthase